MDDEDVYERNEQLEKRNFYLSLSVTNGQELAHLSGFAIPSEDVQKQEIMDVISKWLALYTLGIVDEIHKCADWIVETTTKVNNFSEAQQEASRVYVTSFAIATIIHLFDCHHIDYTSALSDNSDTDDDLSRDMIKKMILGDM